MDHNEWCHSQYLWHKKRAGKFGWHKIQAKWYASRIDLSWLVVSVFRKKRKAIIANVTANNPLWEKLFGRSS